MPNLAEEELCFGGFIKKSGERRSIKVENRVNSTVHIDVLASNLLPHLYLGEILPQDNAIITAHNSAETQTWFFENALNILENWPPFSPHLNIIQTLWSILKDRVAKRHPKNVDDLENSFRKSFLPSQTFMLRKFSNR